MQRRSLKARRRGSVDFLPIGEPGLDTYRPDHSDFLLEGAAVFTQVSSPSRTPLTYRAVYQRLTRRLARDCEYLRTTRYGSPWFRDLGRHYAVNQRNHLCRADINLTDLARELGVIGPQDDVLQEGAIPQPPADALRAGT